MVSVVQYLGKFEMRGIRPYNLVNKSKKGDLFRFYAQRSHQSVLRVRVFFRG
jgi:hypothetical protein